VSAIDLLLFHPPSVYDFRRKTIMYGPISDLFPSSPVFEMYPLGFLTMTDYLELRSPSLLKSAIPRCRLSSGASRRRILIAG
jgi:hypothetical protein